jgi:DNA-directed RNA polymerase specialized sigma24 family protein
MSLSEKEYTELYKHALKQAHRFIGSSDFAYDIAQNSLLSYISSKTPIENPKSWLSIVVKRNALKLINAEKKENELIKVSAQQQKSKPDKVDEEATDIFKLSPQKIMLYLGKKDYVIYQMLKKHEFSATKCAESEKIPLETVKSHLRRLKRNILSNHLVEDGWRHGNNILNYNQYLRISRGINKIIECVKKKQLSGLRNYFRKVDNQLLEELFSGVEACYEWNISFEDDVYKLFIVCEPVIPMPKFIEISLKFNNSNFLFILDAVEKKPFIVGKGTIEKITKYKKKGKIDLTEEQIVSILSDKITTI